jgi:hypothetical protein
LFALNDKIRPKSGKEVFSMMIRTEKDVASFEEAVNSCRRTVWLVAPNGKQFNLKSVKERYDGIAMLLRDRFGEMEIFTSCPEDEMIMMEFYGKHLYQAA